MRAIDDKEAEREWDCMWREQRDRVATSAGLIRSSAFTRELPRWYGLPDEWHEPLSKLLAADRARRKAAAEALAVETEKKERAELARLLAKYGAAQETRVRCDGCGNEIDPDTCHCGDPIRGHTYEHAPYPMGCDCGRAQPWNALNTVGAGIAK